MLVLVENNKDGNKYEKKKMISRKQCRSKKYIDRD